MLTASEVTIGIPFLNAAATLGDAIRSVFAQRFEGWTLLLLDDGSTDTSLEIAQSVRDPRVQVVSDGANRGLAARLNEIARRATSPLLARMDADDVMHPERLALQVAHFREHPETDVLGTACYTIDWAGEPIGVRGLGPLRASTREVLYGSPFVHPTVMFRTAFARENPYDEAYPRAEDLALWCRIWEKAHCALLPEPLLFYRELIPVNLRNYLYSTRTTREIVRKFGATVLPGHERCARLLVIHLSDVAYRVTGRFGGQRWLVYRRSHALESDERAAARAVLSEVWSTPVPGLGLRP